VPRARDRLRIAMFASNYSPHPGGLEVMVRSLARGLAERHDVVLVTSGYSATSGVSREDGMVVHRLPALHAAESLGVPYPVPAGPGLRRALAAAASADVVHAHGALYFQTLLARRVARRTKAPLVLTEHVGFVSYEQPAIDAIQRAAWAVIGDRMIRNADAVVTYNARVREWLAVRGGRPVRYVGNGVDLDRFRPRPDAERRVLRRSFGLPESGVLALFAGRDAAKKNLDVVLRAPRDDYTLVVTGARRNLSGANLVDLGVLPHEQMADLFAAVDVLVHPASGEGFPLAVQEAVAAGVPVVLLWDEGYGQWMPRTLVVACDGLDDVAPQLAALARDGARRDALARTGRAWVEANWSWAATVAAYEEIYHDVIDRAR
jgi:glycosyltransferase involved in cell wall biosynthesis